MLLLEIFPLQFRLWADVLECDAVGCVCLTQTGCFKPNLSPVLLPSDGVTAEGQGSMDGTETPIIRTEFPHICQPVAISLFATASQVAATAPFSWLAAGRSSHRGQ